MQEVLLNELNQTISNWKRGNDQQGVLHFNQAIDELIILMEDIDMRKADIQLNKLFNILKKIYDNVIKEDISSIIDILEYDLKPLITSLIKELKR